MVLRGVRVFFRVFGVLVVFKGFRGSGFRV